MSIEAQHPLYAARVLEWKLMRDSERETLIKESTADYLPMPAGFTAQADAGAAMYAAYLSRAEFPEILLPTLSGTVGVIHRLEAQIELPDALLPLTEIATKDGQPLEAFHQRITTEILQTGRFGVLAEAADLSTDEGKFLSAQREGLPWLAGYPTEAVINWADDASFFCLDESGLEFDPDSFEHKAKKRWRVLRWDAAASVYTQQIYDPDAGPVIVPEAGGRGAAFTRIPFTVVGPRDLSLMPDNPPLIGVARAAKAIYQLTADYRHQMFHSGQETLVLYGATDKQVPSVVGAGVIITMGKDGKAEYVGPKGTGIEAHRLAIAEKRQHAVQAGARLFDSGDKHAVESGDALRLRFAAQTATLTTVSVASARCLEKSLRFAAQMVGADPEQVVVKPNLAFIDTVLGADEVVNLVKAWQSGAIAYETLYENLQKGDVASMERTAEEERSLIEQEAPALGPVGRDPPGTKEPGAADSVTPPA